MIVKLLRDPILHFLLTGGVLFFVAGLLRDEELLPADDKLITVDRAGLLTYMQYQSNAFDPATFEMALDNLDDRSLQELIHNYVAEEVLYREARALGLEQSDYIIRQRMVDKMRFLLTDLAGGEAQPTTAELQGWLEQNAELYRIAPAVSFTHVFIDAGSSGDAQARARANAMLATLNERKAGFNDAVEEGDRFPFLRNYVERTLDFVSGHFGTGFAQALQQLQPDPGRWQGPLQSEYGYHLLLLTALSPGRDPQLEEVRADVLRDYVAQRSETRLATMVDDVRAQYRVEVEALRTADAGK